MTLESQLYVDEPEKVDEFHLHEAVDRLWLTCCMIEQHLLTHPAINQNEEILALVQSATDKLHDAYQAAGALRFRD